MNFCVGKRIRWVAALFSLCAISTFSYADNAEIFWVYETTGGYLDSSPVITDLDGDNNPDICMTSLAGPVFVLDAYGREIWKNDLQERISTAPTAADVSGDGAPELFVLADTGHLYCLEGNTGDIIWICDVVSGAKLDSVVHPEGRPEFVIKHGGTTVVAADINADGVVEVLTNTQNGMLVCLNASGDVLWRYEAGEDLPAPPAVGDIDGDGVAEVLISSLSYPAICLSAEGQLLWRYTADAELPAMGYDRDITSPVVVDLNGDGTNEVVTCDKTTMLALDGGGTVVWATPRVTRTKVDASLTIADIDQDGTPEIYAIDLVGNVVRVGADGTRAWITNVGHRCRRSASIADVDGDGVTEIVVGAYTGKIHILTPDGTIEEELPIGSGTNATSSVADLLGDGSMCVVTPEITGNLSVYRWARGESESTVLVPGYRGGNTRTASSFVSRTERTRYFNSISTGSLYGRDAEFTVEVVNPTDERITVNLTLTHDNGSVDEETESIRGGRTDDVRLRYNGTRLVGNAVFTCTVSRGDDVIESHTFTRPVLPYSATLTALQAQNDRIAALMSQIPDQSGVVERHAYLGMALPEHAASIENLSNLSPLQRRELWNNLTTLSEEFTTLETRMNAARTASTALAVSSANPWAPFGGMDELAEDRMGGDSLSVEAFRGEVESAALNVWNFSGTAKTLRVTMSALTSGENSVSNAVIVREVVAISTQRAKMSADALPQLRGSCTIVVPAWSARQVWLEIHTSDLSAGEWTGRIQLRSMAVGGEQITAPLTVSVWSVPQSREHVFDLCGWANTSPTGVLEDMFSHGMNVFTDARPVPCEFDAEGNITSADYSELDAYMATHAPNGTAMFHSFVNLTGPAERNTPVWNRAYDAAVKQFVAHVREIGFDYDDYAYYPVDEPGLQNGRRVEQFVQKSTLVHQADPDIHIYTNPVGMPVEWLTRINQFADIYAPMHCASWHRNAQEDAQIDSLVDIMHGEGHTLWTYTCADNAKHKSPLGYCRAQMWACFNCGHTGGGFYTYSRGQSSWHMGTMDYNLIYDAEEGPVPSKRWEAVRDGTEDYSMLMALRAAADAPGADPELARRARALLAGDVVTVGNFNGLDEDGMTPGKDGFPGVRRVADRRYATIISVRRQIRDLLQGFGQ